MNDLVEHRERSDRFQLLNGEWKFQYYNSIYDVTESFYEKGYDAIGVQEIADAAGVTKPTLYHYFGSKYGLLQAVAMEGYADLQTGRSHPISGGSSIKP